LSYEKLPRSLILTGGSMKILILTLMLSTFWQPGAQASVKPPVYPVHIMPDQRIEADDVSLRISDETEALETSYVSEAIRVGKKNMDWLIHMNSLKPDGQKIALTKPGELPSYPIDKPKFNSPTLIENTYKELSSGIPANMKTILFENGAFTDEPGLDLETYILWAKKVDKMYQSATRWRLMEPNLYWYKMNKQNDIRGYYFLSKEENLTQKLQNFSTLSDADKTRLTPYLVNICENTRGVNAGCESQLKNSIQSQKVNEYYLSYNPNSKEMFDSLFQIQGTRSDFVWNSSAPNLATIPMRITPSEKVNQYLKVNIEDEWKWNDWHLQLNLTNDADVHVVFSPGATPHVNGIAGSEITMDDNAPLTEWDVQWTIRHEFGHVLGFPDCYVEFYDDNLQMMVNYQTDVTNLMCSRAGKMQELHYNELKKAYFH
jgi:hypothetical protein